MDEDTAMAGGEKDTQTHAMQTLEVISTASRKKSHPRAACFICESRSQYNQFKTGPI